MPKKSDFKYRHENYKSICLDCKYLLNLHEFPIESKKGYCYIGFCKFVFGGDKQFLLFNEGIIVLIVKNFLDIFENGKRS